MSDSHKLQRAAVKVTLDKVMKYIDKNPQENICKMLSVAEKLTKSIFPAGNLEKMKEVVRGESIENSSYKLFLTDTTTGRPLNCWECLVMEFNGKRITI